MTKSKNIPLAGKVRVFALTAVSTGITMGIVCMTESPSLAQTADKSAAHSVKAPESQAHTAVAAREGEPTTPASPASTVSSSGPSAASPPTSAAKTNDASNTPSVTEARRGNKTFAVGKILVNARPEQIWKILTDYNNAPDIFTNLQKCEVVEDKGRNKLVRQLVHPKGTPINLDYIVEITETAPTLMEWHRKSGALKEVAGSWRLEQSEADGPTKVTYSIYLDGGLLLPAWLLRGQSKSYLPELLNAIKTASEKDSKTAARKTGRLGVLL